MTISQFCALPDWEKTQLMDWEHERIKKLIDLKQELVKQEKLYASEYINLMIAIWG